MNKKDPPSPQQKSGPPEVVMKAIARKVSRGISVEALADQIKVHRSTLFRYLAGRRKINSESFLALCAAIDLTESDLKELLDSAKSN